MRRWLAAVALAALCCEPSFADEWLDRAGCKDKVDIYYPPTAIRKNEVGSVLVEFTVEGNGAPTGITTDKSKTPWYIQDAAKRVVRLMTCSPDSKWAEDGGLQRRLRLNVIFHLKGLDETPGKVDPDADYVVITASPIVTR